MRKLEDLMINPFFRYFKEISDIPRESGNEQMISDYLVNFAKERKLEVIQDENLNVVIKKPATTGYENAPTVILQGHMDMVCVKTTDSNHDFKKDPIKLRVIDNMMYATDTTLGADNGYALAYGLSILESNEIKHPALEVVFTSQEETNMNGAITLDTSLLEGRILINLDSNIDNEILVSSTGGIITTHCIEVERINIENLLALKISVEGLKGGHSGEDIHKERGNANKILGRVLNELNSKIDLYLGDIKGGTSSNAISRESSAEIFVNIDKIDEIKQIVSKYDEILKDELKTSDQDINIKLTKISSKKEVFSKKCANKIIELLILIPNGVQSMSLEVEGLVETSNNLGVIKVEDNKILVECEIRSCVRTKRQEIEDILEKIGQLLDIDYFTRDPYPEWNFNKNSKITGIFKDSYRSIHNEEMKIQALHAGLETGVFLEKMPYLDAVAYGPNAYELHSPKEHMDINSCFKVWNILIAVLSNMNNY